MSAAPIERGVYDGGADGPSLYVREEAGDHVFAFVSAGVVYTRRYPADGGPSPLEAMHVPADDVAEQVARLRWEARAAREEREVLTVEVDALTSALWAAVHYLPEREAEKVRNIYRKAEGK